MANITNQLRPAHDWVEYVSAGAANGQVDYIGGSNDLAMTLDSGEQQEHTIYPSMMIVGVAGLVVLVNHDGTTRGITALAGVPYPVQPASFAGAATLAEEICFFYNAP